MLGRKFFVTIFAGLSLLLMSLPAYAQSEWRYFSGDITEVNGAYSNPWGIDLNTNISGSANFTPDIYYAPDPYYVDDVNGDGGSLEVIIYGSINTLTFGSNDTDREFGKPFLYLEDPTNNLLAIDLDEYFGSGSDYFFTPEIGGTATYDFEIKDDVSWYVRGTFDFTPIPIPGAVWLLGSGLVGLMGLRRRFRKS